MFPGKLEGFFERYVDALKYQRCRKEGSGNANIPDENKAADAQADGQNNEGDNNILGDIGMDQGRVVDNIRVTSLRDKHADVDMDKEGTVYDNILGSPTLYNMGPETQSLANEPVEKLSNENRFGSPSLYNMGPETQEEVLRSVDDVDARIERRKWVDMSGIPSFSLGVTQDFALLDEDVVTPKENTHAPNLAGEISNQLTLRPIPLRVCPPGTTVGHLRRDKDKRPVTISEVRKSPFIGRMVDPDVHNTLLGRKGRFQSFMGYVVNAIENNGKCELLKDIDVILIPVDNGGHKFLFVADLKNSRALLIDHEKNEKIVRKRVKKKIRTCDNIKITAMLKNQNPEAGQTSMAQDGSVFRYDQDYLREQFAGLVIQQALPFNHFDHEQTTKVFQNTMQPRYTHVSRSTLKRDAIKLWVPGSYMCVTAHWIEPGTWQMMKRVISFEEFLSPHTGGALFKMLIKVLTNFNLEDKVMSITLDNVSNNTSTIDKLKLKYDPLMGGRFYHSRCVAHIINLVVQAGLGVPAIDAIRESFKTMLKDIFKSSERTRQRYVKICKDAEKPCLRQNWDVPTRWNSNYHMFLSGLKQQNTMAYFHDLLANKNRTTLTPTSLEMCMCLKDHLDAKERKQDKCPLEIPLDFEEDVFDDELQ
nr:zinc finger BED domain-containing protein RICESLEEPER 2-like [Tanacetum cinerariifolium]